MKKNLTRFLLLLIWFITINYYAVFVWCGISIHVSTCVIMGLVFIASNLMLPSKKSDSVKLEILDSGCELLKLFAGSVCIEIIFTVLFFIFCGQLETKDIIIHIVIAVLCESAIFWNGMIRVYLCSSQLGLKWRIIGLLCGWIPVLHLWALENIIRITGHEAIFEKEKILQNAIRAESEICKTKYPLLLVHGVFFRDTNLINYWGRIPAHLRKNGAVIYYAEHQSADSVQGSGEEIAARIKQIVAETGCGKVNLIGHSKGGLDCRYTIAHTDAGKYVASLTTINTPHRGCRFAEYLIDNLPQKAQDAIARKYNKAATFFGDHKPDFTKAVRDLTESACKEINHNTPDAPWVYYQSVGSVMKEAKSGQFPLNMTYRLVKLFDCDNDGLVSVPSMQWGEHFTLITTEGRGVSHGDVIDLSRENIPGFDVRGFYTELVTDLKKRGF